MLIISVLRHPQKNMRLEVRNKSFYCLFLPAEKTKKRRKINYVGRKMQESQEQMDSAKSA